MLKIIKNNEILEFQYNGIKIIQADFPTNVYKDLFLNNQIYIDDKYIKNENILYINELTKGNEFINLTKKSFLQLEIDKLLNDNIINLDLVNNIIKDINNKYDYELLSLCDGDKNKIINQVFEVEDLGYLNDKLFKIILDSINLDEKILIIIDNVSWIKIQDLYKYLNQFNFILLTTDIRKIILNIQMLELIINCNNYSYIDFESTDKIISYLEKNVNENIDNQKFEKFLRETNSLWSIRLFSLIKMI